VFKVQDIASQYIQELHAQFIKRFADKNLTISKQLQRFAADGGKGYIIDHIVTHRINPSTRKHELLVKWEMYDDEEPSWQPLESIFRDAPTVVTGFAKLIKNKTEREAFTKALDVLRKRRK
jgi:hypothetical protein